MVDLTVDRGGERVSVASALALGTIESIMLRRLLDGLYMATGYLAGAFLIAVFVLMMVMAVGRQFGINVPAGDDFTAWAMAAMAFLGLAHTFRSGDLIRMGPIIDRLSGRTRWIAEMVVLTAATGLAAFFAWYAIEMTYYSWLLDDMANGVVAMPLWIPQLGFAVGTVVLLIALADELVCVGMGQPPRYVRPKIPETMPSASPVEGDGDPAVTRLPPLKALPEGA